MAKIIMCFLSVLDFVHSEAVYVSFCHDIMLSWIKKVFACCLCFVRKIICFKMIMRKLSENVNNCTDD